MPVCRCCATEAFLQIGGDGSSRQQTTTLRRGDGPGPHNPFSNPNSNPVHSDLSTCRVLHYTVITRFVLMRVMLSHQPHCYSGCGPKDIRLHSLGIAGPSIENGHLQQPFPPCHRQQVEHPSGSKPRRRCTVKFVRPSYHRDTAESASPKSQICQHVSQSALVCVIIARVGRLFRGAALL